MPTSEGNHFILSLKEEVSVIYVTNEVFRIWLTILNARGLFSDKLLDEREEITKGLFTWLMTHHLHSTVLEVYRAGLDDAIERWDMVFKYTPSFERPMGQRDIDATWQTIPDEISRLTERLPPDAIYRIVLGLHPEVEGMPPPAIRGWTPTILRKNKLAKITLGETIDGIETPIYMEYHQPDPSASQSEEVEHHG